MKSLRPLAWLIIFALPAAGLSAQDAAAPTSGEAGKGAPPVRQPPVVISQTAPEYPEALRWSGIKGTVLVDFVVDRNGLVQNPVVVTSTSPEFDDPAIVAVHQWTFRPATLNGRPVPARLRVPITFQLSGFPDHGREAYPIEKKSGQASPLTVRTARAPVYPYALRQAGVIGRAEATVTVDASGRVLKIEISASTRPEFGQALLAALEGFAFNPAVQDGKPVASVLIYRQAFDDATLEDPTAVDLLQLEQSHPQSIHELEDLDAIPRPVSQRRPLFPKNLPATVTTGSATIRFLIDPDGHAQLPRVLAASDPAFGYAAVEAVSAWIFDPPTLHGHAVVARADVPIHFMLGPPEK